MGFRDLLGKFVVLGEEIPSTTVLDAGLGDAAQSPPSSPVAPLPVEGFDLSAVYEQEGILSVPFTAEQALEILHSLPSGLVDDTKRQVLRDILQARSVSPTAIAEDAKRKIDALTAVGARIAGQIAEFIDSTGVEIAKLQQQIHEKRTAVEQAQSQQRQLAQLSRTEAERLQYILQFLG
jgi:hypothetical protein